jgi:uncharacterized protein YcfJ
LFGEKEGIVKIGALNQRYRAHHGPLHEIIGAALGALGGAAIGGVVTGPLGAFVGTIAGAGVGAFASSAADTNARELAAEERWLRRERDSRRKRSTIRSNRS